MRLIRGRRGAGGNTYRGRSKKVQLQTHLLELTRFFIILFNLTPRINKNGWDRDGNELESLVLKLMKGAE